MMGLQRPRLAGRVQARALHAAGGLGRARGRFAVAASAVVQATTATAAAAPPQAEQAVLRSNIVPAAPLVATPTGLASDDDLDAPPAPRTAGRSSAYRCLVLDSRFLPVNTVSWFRAVVMAMDESGRVDVLEYHPGGFAYSAHRAHPLPAVLRVHTFVDVHEFAGRLSLTRKNLMLRDRFRCQYCGCGSVQSLTLDHVVPVCRGGVNSWTNLVTACMACNQRKGDKTLAQLGWKLPRAPREPTPSEVGVVAGLSANDLAAPPPLWEPYLANLRAALDKAKHRAARAAAATATGAASAGSGSDASEQGLVSVTLHAAGPKSKAAAAAAAAAAAGGARSASAPGGRKPGGKASAKRGSVKRLR